jgi:hypothetical protein
LGKKEKLDLILCDVSRKHSYWLSQGSTNGEKIAIVLGRSNQESKKMSSKFLNSSASNPGPQPTCARRKYLVLQTLQDRSYQASGAIERKGFQVFHPELRLTVAGGFAAGPDRECSVVDLSFHLRSWVDALRTKAMQMNLSKIWFNELLQNAAFPAVVLAFACAPLNNEIADVRTGRFNDHFTPQHLQALPATSAHR